MNEAEFHANFTAYTAIMANFTAYTAIMAEGGRVGFCSCRICGATVMADSRDGFDTASRHLDWHLAQQEEGGE